MVWLTFLAKIITPVVVAYKITTGSRFHARGVATYLLAISGAMALYAGTDLMVKEDARRTAVNVRLRGADNSRVPIAAAELGISGFLFLLAGLTSGKVTFVHHPEWVTVPAIVTAVEPVTYPQGAVRYRVRFAYTDAHGQEQESADEVVTNRWKTGDGCLAVYQPDRPDLASMGVPIA